MSGWSTVQLHEIAETVDYGLTASACLEPLGPKFLRITDIQNGKVSWDQVPWCECDSNTAARAQLIPGDIVFARTGATTGKSFLIRACPEGAVFASYLIRVRLGDGVDSLYVSHYFQSAGYWEQIYRSARGVAQPGVNATMLKSLAIPLPPIAEQRRIAAILDKAEALRAKRRAALAQLDALTQSIFLDMFGDPATNPKGWPTAPLANVCSIAGQYGLGLSSTRHTEDLPRYVRITDIDDSGELVGSPVAPLGDTGDWEGFYLEEGDVLFARSGATVGKTFIYQQRYGSCTFAGYLVRFRTDRERLLPEVLFHFTKSQAYYRWVHARQRVVAQPNINAQQYGRDLEVLVPPISLQDSFVEVLSGLNALRRCGTTSLAELDALFASLQHRAFRGEL